MSRNVVFAFLKTDMTKACHSTTLLLDLGITIHHGTRRAQPIPRIPHRSKSSFRITSSQNPPMSRPNQGREAYILDSASAEKCIERSRTSGSKHTGLCFYAFGTTKMAIPELLTWIMAPEMQQLGGR